MSNNNREQTCKNSSCEFKRKYAWRSYFKVLEDYEDLSRRFRDLSRRVLALEGDNKEIELPDHFKNELVENMKCLDCVVCYEVMTKQTFTLTKCYHKICKNCVAKLDKCPICRKKL